MLVSWVMLLLQLRWLLPRGCCWDGHLDVLGGGVLPIWRRRLLLLRLRLWGNLLRRLRRSRAPSLGSSLLSVLRHGLLEVRVGRGRDFSRRAGRALSILTGLLEVERCVRVACWGGTNRLRGGGWLALLRKSQVAHLWRGSFAGRVIRLRGILSRWRRSSPAVLSLLWLLLRILMLLRTRHGGASVIGRVLRMRRRL